MKAISLSVYEFTVESEKDKDDATKFQLKPLSGIQKVTVGDIRQRDGRAAALKYAVKSGLKGWKNFKNKDETGLEPYTEDQDANIAKLDELTLVEIFNSIAGASELSEDDKKKS